jgi:(S)-2-hydroxy-acid oxidase
MLTTDAQLWGKRETDVRNSF